MSATDTWAPPDSAPVPQSALGPSERKSDYLGGVERILYSVTERLELGGGRPGERRKRGYSASRY
jgi:hypothetical protein